jgi:vitamin B12 transporter
MRYTQGATLSPIIPGTPPGCDQFSQPKPRVSHKTLHQGLISMQPSGLATPEACKEISPGYAFFAYPGYKVLGENLTPKAVRGNVLFAIVFALFNSAFCFAQNTSLSVTIVDPQHAAIPGARVAVYPPGSSLAMRGNADEQGRYTVALPSTGDFLVEVDAEGFRKISKQVSIVTARTEDVIISLDLAGIDSSIVVTASDMPQTVDQTSKAITVVGAEEIHNRDEYTLAGVLSAVPGIQTHNVGGPGQSTSLRVRGLRSDSSAILIDGMRFRDAATAQGDAGSFLGQLNIIAPDRVEILRGSGSSLYGTNAASGVVNIITDAGGGATHGVVQAEGGNLGFARGRMQIGGGRLNDRVKYSAGLLHLNVMRGVDGNGRNRSTGGQASLIYNPASQTTLSGRFYGSDDFVQLNISPTGAGIPATNIPSSVIVPAVAGVTFFADRDDPDSRRASRFYTTAVKLQQTLSSAVTVQASYQRMHTLRIFANGPAGFGFQPVVANYSRLIGNIDTFDSRATARLSRWNQLTAGYEFERETYNEIQDNNLPGSQRIRTQTDIRQRAGAWYFQDQSGLLQNRLQISVSGRAQTFALRHPRFQATGIANTYDRVQLVPPPKALTADLSISYFVTTRGTKLRAHVGNAYRAPGLFERFGGGFFTSPATGELVFTPYGDPFLTPDRYNSVDAGIDQYLWRDRARISATYFYTRVVTITAFDLGTTVRPATDRFGRSSGYINGSGGLSRGLELAWELRPASSFSLNASYSYTRANLDRDITIPGFWRVLGAPRHAFTLVATKRIRTRGILVMDLSSTSEIFGNFTAAGRARAYRYPSFTKADVSAAYDLWKADSGTLRLNTRIENILNRKYYDLGWLAPGIAFVAGTTFQF